MTATAIVLVAAFSAILSSCATPRTASRQTVSTDVAAVRLSSRPAAPVTTTPAGSVEARVDTGSPHYTAADVDFMQGMIAHHAQALVMTSLIPARSARPEIRLLATRIEVSQRDEIAMMQQWLKDHHQQVPDPNAEHAQHHAAGHAMQTSRPGMAMSGMLMPGMLTPEQLDQLSKATGNAFDRLFLRFMIQHHEGALTMVAKLFGTTGAGQVAEVFRFASDVDADQRAEIARMRSLLGRLPP